jgi:hypothetical protein
MKQPADVTRPRAPTLQRADLNVGRVARHAQVLADERAHLVDRALPSGARAARTGMMPRSK